MLYIFILIGICLLYLFLQNRKLKNRIGAICHFCDQQEQLNMTQYNINKSGIDAQTEILNTMREFWNVVKVIAENNERGF